MKAVNDIRCATAATYSTSAYARLSIFSRSRFVVGSSSARTPQFKQNVSASASRIISDARTYKSSTA